MEDIIVKAGSFVAIIILGYLTKRIGWFKQEDFLILSKIVVRITAPAAIALSMVGKDIDLAMLSLILLGLGTGIVLIIVGYLINLGNSKSQQSFEMLNLGGYNIGSFSLPFVQSFLGPVGLITVSLFDVGNAAISLGGAYGAAAMVKDGRGFDFKLIANKLLHSVPFVVYVILVSMNLCGLQLPSPAISLLQVLANSNSFLAMFMLGVGFELKGDMTQIARIVRILVVRYGVSGIMAALIFFLTPFELEVRQTIVIVMFSPIASIAPAFTAELGDDVGLASAVNTISIICSIVIIITLLTVML